MQRVAVTAWPSQAKPNRAEPSRRAEGDIPLSFEPRSIGPFPGVGMDACARKRGTVLFSTCLSPVVSVYPNFSAFFKSALKSWPALTFAIASPAPARSVGRRARGVYIPVAEMAWNSHEREKREREEEKITTKQQNKHRNENGVICETRRE